MLKWMGISLVIVLAAGCGAQADKVAEDPGATSDSCARLASEPEVAGDGASGIVRFSAEIGPDELETWLGRRSAAGAPQLSLSSFPELEKSQTLSVCVYEVEPRPVPGPPGNSSEANGVRVLVGAEGWTVFGVGPLETLMDESKQVGADAPTS